MHSLSDSSYTKQELYVSLLFSKFNEDSKNVQFHLERRTVNGSVAYPSFELCLSNTHTLLSPRVRNIPTPGRTKLP